MIKTPLRKNIFRIFMALMVMAFLIPQAGLAAEKKKHFVVVIDAGHGGHDSGAAENGVMEKNINLGVALKLGELIKKKLKNTEVIYTRDGDYFLSLQKRADIANKAGADLFISIHTNSVDKSNTNRANVSGASTYVLGLHKETDNLGVAQRENSVIELDKDDKTRYTNFNPQEDESYIIYEMTAKKNLQNSIRFASDVQKEMEKGGRKNRGVNQAGFWVLWSTAMPAALIELDFICNPEQAKFLGSEDGQEKLASYIFNAVKNYEEYYRKSTMASNEKPQWAETAESKMADKSMRNPVKATQNGFSRKSTKAKKEEKQPEAPTETEEIHVNNPVLEEEIAQVEETTEEIYDPDAPTVMTATEMGDELNFVPETQKKERVKNSKKAKEQQTSQRRSRVKANRSSIKTSYRVMLFASENELNPNHDLFKGLTPVSAIHENNLYKYTYGESESKEEMDALLDEISPIFPEAQVIKCLSN